MTPRQDHSLISEKALHHTDCQQLRRILVSTVRFADEQEQRLTARKAAIEGVLRDMVRPSPCQIIDPLPRIKNVEDTDHAE